MVTASLALSCLAVQEWLRDRASTRAPLYRAGLPDAVLCLVFLAVTMAVAGGGIRPMVLESATLALGGMAWLWLTRFRREPSLVYLGIGLVVASPIRVGLGASRLG